MHIYDHNDFTVNFRKMQEDLLTAPVVPASEWQSQDVSSRPELATPELANTILKFDIPDTPEELGKITSARLPWAEDHFRERVRGIPVNPAPSEAWWPFRQNKQGNTNKDHKSEGGTAFSHTYPERMWPKFAGITVENSSDLPSTHMPRRGIRFAYGDLGDVVDQLVRNPETRQAYLPIWFPEDTGAVHRKRVPCTLGYHFLIRENTLNISYYMRSCDALRHFQDDVYMAGRLAQWVVDQMANAPLAVPGIKLGTLHMYMASFHCWVGDLPMIEFRLKGGQL